MIIEGKQRETAATTLDSTMLPNSSLSRISSRLVKPRHSPLRHRQGHVSCSDKHEVLCIRNTSTCAAPTCQFHASISNHAASFSVDFSFQTFLLFSHQPNRPRQSNAPASCQSSLSLAGHIHLLPHHRTKSKPHRESFGLPFEFRSSCVLVGQPPLCLEESTSEEIHTLPLLPCATHQPVDA